MSKQKYFKSAVGISIADNAIMIASLSGNRDEIVVDKLFAMPTLPKTIMHGKILDADSIANQIIKAFTEERINMRTNVIIGINDKTYLKLIETHQYTNEDDIRDYIGIKLNELATFLQEEYHFAFRNLKGYEETLVKRLLLVATPNSKLNAIQEVVSIAGINLSTIDLVPLAVVRCIHWNNYLGNDNALTVYVDRDYTDLNIVENGQIKYTYTFRKNYSDIVKDEFNIEDWLQRIRNMMYSYQNLDVDNGDIKRIVLATNMPGATPLEAALKTAFSELSVTRYQVDDNLTMKSSYTSEGEGRSIREPFIGAIGLGLKYFEAAHDSIDLTRVKRQLEPVLNRTDLGAFAVILVVIAGLFVGANFYLVNQNKIVNKQIERIKKQIASFQTGEYLLQQNQLRELKEKIDKLDFIDKDGVKRVDILAKIITGMPNDIYFTNFSMSTDYAIKVQAQAEFPQSIYRFYSYLTQYFHGVTIQSIALAQPGAGVKNQAETEIQPEVKHSFSIMCKWDPNERITTANRL